jgi:hypothetical protein
MQGPFSKDYEQLEHVVWVPSSGIELVLSTNYLPVAQIRIRCKNGQVSLDDIKIIVAMTIFCGVQLQAKFCFFVPQISSFVFLFLYKF